MSKFFYVYKTTNLITGKQYVGDHSAIKQKDTYLGSGFLLIKAVKNYGYKNFKKEILEYFNTKEEAFDAQEKYIIQFNTLKPKGYNISPKGGHNVQNSISEETKLKISKKNKGKLLGIKLSEEHKRKISEGNKGKITPIETKIKMSLASKGKPKSEEHAKKCRIANLGKKQTEECKRKRSISMKGKNLGPKSEETKYKLSLAKKGKTWEEIYGIEGAIARRNKRIYK